jgi:acetyl-CoA synthetase
MADPRDPEISALLHEDRVFEPPAEFRANATVKDTTPYEEAERDPEGFWPGSRPSSSGAAHGRACSTGAIRRMPNGSSAGSSTSPSIASTVIFAGPGATRPQIIWEGEPAIAGR